MTNKLLDVQSKMSNVMGLGVRWILRCLLVMLMLSVATNSASSQDFLPSDKWVAITSKDPKPPHVEVVSSDVQETVLRVTIPGYFERKVEAEGTTYAYFTLPNSPHAMEKGCPELPFLAVALAIPDRGQVDVSIDHHKTMVKKVHHYLPSKGHFPRTIDPSSVPYTFSDVYRKDALYPEKQATFSKPFILRNVRGTTLGIHPFQYNPMKRNMIISETLMIHVVTKVTKGVFGENILTEARHVRQSHEFLGMYSTRFINYSQHSLRYPPVGETGNMLIITNDSFYDAMLPFLYWKLQKGIPTQMVKLSDVGSTANNVKNYIQYKYNTDGVTFILLVGDAAEMPYLTGTAGNVVGNAADPRYALLAGSDTYPDAIVSRFPAQTTTEVSTMVNRVINYEKTPSASASWYHLGSGIASNDGSPTDWERCNWLRTDLLGYTYTSVDQIYDPGATASQVTTALNAGRSIVNYIGHGSETAWGTTGFSVTNINALSNTDMVPFIFDVACVNGRFNRSGGDCFGEAWLKVGLPSAPKGAIGMYASSTNQDWVPPCDAQAESIDRLVDDSYHTFGALCFNGVMKGIDNYSYPTDEQLYQQWHIFGDCSVMVFTNTPTAMSVTHGGMLPIGRTTYTVTVSGIQNALCALYNETTHTLYGSAYTNASGSAVITLDPTPSGTMTLALTVTAFNRMPYLDTVTVTPTYGGMKLVSSVSGVLTANNTVMSASTGLSFDEPFSIPIATDTLYCPWWFIGGDYSSYVVMQNTSGSSINVTPTFYYTGGSFTPVAINIPANETKHFDVRNYIYGLAGNIYGGIKLVSSVSGVLTANNTVMSASTGLSFDEPFSIPITTNTLYCPWWFIGGDYASYVVMQNTSASPITVTPTIYYTGGSYIATPIAISAHETKFFDVRLYSANLAGNTYGGIKLVSSASGTLIANNTVMSASTGLSFDEPFSIPIATNTLYCPWWFIGGDYGSYVVMQNTSASPITVTPTIYYTGGSYIATPIAISAHETKFFDVRLYSANLAGNTYGGIKLVSSASGVLTANNTVMSPSTGLSFDEPFSTPIATTTLYCPWWFIGGDYGSYVVMQNTSDTEITVTPTMYYTDGSHTPSSAPASGWSDFPTIPAHETRYFNVRDYF